MVGYTWFALNRGCGEMAKVIIFWGTESLSVPGAVLCAGVQCGPGGCTDHRGTSHTHKPAGLAEWDGIKDFPEEGTLKLRAAEAVGPREWGFRQKEHQTAAYLRLGKSSV